MNKIRACFVLINLHNSSGLKSPVFLEPKCFCRSSKVEISKILILRVFSLIIPSPFRHHHFYKPIGVKTLSCFFNICIDICI